MRIFPPRVEQQLIAKKFQRRKGRRPANAERQKAKNAKSVAGLWTAQKIGVMTLISNIHQGVVTVSSCRSSILRKMLMGLCGFVWTAFVFGHMAGNLLILVSAEAYNKYGHAIVSNKILLYGTEVVLSFALLGHVILGLQLTWENKKAKPQKYATGASPQKKSSLASRTMAYQGSIILAFIIYHLITFKYGPEYEVTYDGVVMRDLHRLIVEVFSDPLYVGGYVICLLLLGWHLSHGVSSVFQTMGLNHPKYTPTIKTVGWVYAVVVAAGFIVQPIYVYLLH